jgi:hypothetical protein
MGEGWVRVISVREKSSSHKSVRPEPVEEPLFLQHAHQYASGSAPKMLGHAQTLHRLYPDLDRAYLHDRITLETLADYGAQDPES